MLRTSCKSIVTVIKFEGVASSPRALNCERNWKRSEQKSNQTLHKIRCRNRPKRCSFRHLLPERLRSRYRTQKSRSQGSPGVSPEGPRATVERPREVPGAPPERPRSAQRVQKSSGELKTALWELKRLPPEASRPSFLKLSGLLLGPPQLVVLQSSPRTQASRGRR